MKGIVRRQSESGLKSAGQILLAKLKAYISKRDLEEGKRIHEEAVLSGHDSAIHVANALLNMYCKCRSMADARRMFDNIKRPDVVSWTTLILAYAENGNGTAALDLFDTMRCRGCAPNTVTYVAALKACTALTLDGRSAACKERGTYVHSLASENGCASDLYVQSALIDMYSKCGSMSDARKVFDDMKHPDVVSWTALTLGYAQNGQGDTALELFGKMRSQGCAPDARTFVAALKACTALALKHDLTGCREWGKQIHMLASQNGCDADIYVQSTLIDMYAKCGRMLDARKVFSSMKRLNVVAWNALILGYAENAEGNTALKLFNTMKDRGFRPDSTTIVAALKACSALASEQDGCQSAELIERGRELHAFASEIACDSVNYVRNTLIDMYAKCGSMVDARRVFDSMERPDVVSWTALILGYGLNGEGTCALELFRRMRSQRCAADSATFLAVFKACGLVGALEFGKRIHAELDNSIELDTMLLTSLVDFYSKCGSLLEARKVFDSYSGLRDLTTWNALLAGHCRLGDMQGALALLQELQDAGFRPNHVTFASILMCCSHAGLVKKGIDIFKIMSTTYGIAPTVEHCNCMVDILARSRRLEDALAFLQTMPCSPNAVTWMTLLAACRKWKNVETGRVAFKSLLTLDSTNPAAYVLMADIYGSSGLREEKEAMQEARSKLKSWKKPGQSSWTSELGEVHTFVARNSDISKENI